MSVTPSTSAPERVSVTVMIKASAERVWAMVSDVTRMSEWSPEVQSCAWRGGARGPAVGARFTGRNQNGWHRWSTTCVVTVADPGREFAFRVSVLGATVADWSYRITPVADGCDVTESTADLRWRVLKVGTVPFTGVRDRANHNRTGMEQTLARVKAAAERPTP